MPDISSLGHTKRLCNALRTSYPCPPTPILGKASKAVCSLIMLFLAVNGSDVKFWVGQERVRICSHAQILSFASGGSTGGSRICNVRIV